MKKRNYAKLTMEQRDAIVAAYERGDKIDVIAAEFGVSREYPGQLAKRRGIPRRLRWPQDDNET